jgi:hypothetical protein
MTDIERCAAEICAQLLGGKAKPVDIPGGEPGCHDYDIVLSSGRRIALEVTRSTVPAERAARAALNRERAVPGLTVSWRLNIPSDIDDVRGLFRDSPSQLNILAAQGVHHFDTRELPQDPVVRAAVEGLAALAVRRGADFPAFEPPSLFFSSTEFGATAADVVVGLVEREAGKADNLRKLRKAGAQEAHLWVWLERTHGGAYTMVASHRHLPQRTPRFPQDITTIWVAGLGAHRDGQPAPKGLWRVTAEGQWEDLTSTLADTASRDVARR